MMGNGQLRECLCMLRGLRVAILGVGNVLKADDGAGPLLCQALHGIVAAPVIDAGTAPENHLGPIIRARPQRLLVVDAVDFGGHPGAIAIFHARQIRDVAVSTHAVSLRLLVNVLRDEIDVDVLLLGIQPESTQLDKPVSAPVQEAIETLTEMLREAFPAAGSEAKPSPRIPIKPYSNGKTPVRSNAKSRQ